MLYGHVLQPCIRNGEWFEIRKSLSTAVSNAKAREVVGNRVKWVEKAERATRDFFLETKICVNGYDPLTGVELQAHNTILARGQFYASSTRWI